MRHRYLLPLLLALGGCATATHLQVPVGYCDPPLPSHYNPAFAPRVDFDALLTPALLGEITVANGLIVAAHMWFGFVLTSMIMNHRYEGMKWSLTVIDGLHLLGVLLIQGAVIGVFG